MTPPPKAAARTAAVLAGVLLAAASLPGAAAPPAPPFDVAYRAWDLVTDLARRTGDAGISGECGKAFRPFVIPGLRRQTKQEQDATASVCVQAARAACADGKLRALGDIAKKCEEFR